MTTYPRLRFRLSAAVAFLLHLLAATTCHGFSLVVSNLLGNTTPQASLQTSGGTPLAAGSLGQALSISPPAEHTAASLASQCGMAAFWPVTTVFGSALQVGRGAGSVHGGVQGEVQQPLSYATGASWVGKSIFLVFYNATTRQAATEWLLLEFPSEVFLADSLQGLEFQRRLHLSAATVRVGQRDALGNLHTAPISIATSYSTWIQAALAPTAPAAQRLPLADPDGDGIGNLLEYALGGDPTVADRSLAALSITRLPATPTEPESVIVGWAESETSGHANVQLWAGDGRQAWQLVGGTHTAIAPRPLPALIRWRQAKVPVTLGTQFFRLSATMN